MQKLSEKAIASSFKLETLAERITLIEQRLELAEDRIEYTRKKKWTNYISANPINILQNIFGGGDVQRDNIAITQCQRKLIAKGQVISDRIPERNRLEAQERQLQLSLLSIRTASIAPPPKPQPVPAVAPLPPVNYLEQNAAIAKAKIAIANSLSLSQIRELIKELKPVQQQEQLKTRFDTTYKQVKKSQQLWQDPKKRKKLESLLSQLEKLIESESSSKVNQASLNPIFEEPESSSEASESGLSDSELGALLGVSNLVIRDCRVKKRKPPAALKKQLLEWEVQGELWVRKS